ncbi:MAG: phosphate-starvation-inducible PsiE family protein [Gallionellaceae bacterium]|nr:phosphate-starvation-inducible PsiE family protein [Gallionellaceae bacterium]
MTQNRFFNCECKNSIKGLNVWLLSLVENLGLLVIAIATIIAMTGEIIIMVKAARVTMADLLLLFLYLEVLTMVGLHYNTGKMPVRFPLYIGIVAMARYLIVDMKEMDDWRMIAVTCSILLLALAVFLIRLGHVRYPYPDDGQATKQ